MIVIHHNPECGTSRNVLKTLQAAGYEPTGNRVPKNRMEQAAASRLVCRSEPHSQRSVTRIQITGKRIRPARKRCQRRHANRCNVAASGVS